MHPKNYLVGTLTPVNIASRGGAKEGLHGPPPRFTLARLCVALLVGLGFSVLASSPAAANPDDPCEGVTVVVEYDGDVETGCAAGDIENGLDALREADFELEFVSGQAGMVCQINGLPADAGECASAPAADSFWGYWYSDGDEWEFSTAGAGTRTPEDGTVEGWIFGDGDSEPGIDPGVAQAEAGGDDNATDNAASGSADSQPSWWDQYSWVLAIVVILAVIALGVWVKYRQRQPRD